MPSLHQRQEIGAESCNQNGGLDSHPDLDILALSRAREIRRSDESLFPFDQQAFRVKVGAHRGGHRCFVMASHV